VTLHAAAEGLADELHSVADAEHGNAEIEDGGVALRGAVGVNARGAAGEDDALGCQFADACGRDVVPHDLAVDVLLADAAGDELGVLGAEVENEHALGGEGVLLHRVSRRRT